MTDAKIVFGSAARAQMMRGADAMANAVKVTLGPRGRNVLLETDFEAPEVTKDGAAVAARIEFADTFANMGARFLRQVAMETGAKAGDGASTATLLANSILRGGVHAVGADLGALGVKRGIELAVETVVSHIKSTATPIADNQQIKQIATITANGDEKVGQLIADAVAATGEHGEILVEAGRATDDRLETISGMYFDRGYVSRAFVTDETNLSAELRKPLILIYGKKISSLDGFMPFLDRAIDEKRPLLIIAEDVEHEALTTLVVNRQEGGLKVVAVKAPGFSDHRREALEDLAILTGAKVVLGEPGLDLVDATPDVMGRAQSVRVTVDKTTIIGGGGAADDVQTRCKQLRYTMKRTKSDQERRTLRRRLAKLTSTIAFIHVGGFTETEIQERKGRVDKALRSARTAIEDGFVTGGGAALLHAAKSLEGVMGADCDEFAGIQIVRRALEQPAGQIAENAGADRNQIVAQITASADPRFGFDAKSLEFGDVVRGGVIDATSTVCLALQRAASVAAPLLVTDAVVAEKVVKKMPRHPFACKCSDHDHHHYPGDPYHEHHHAHSH
ncbi:MAG: chaperonin GroEL [Alphaproteobacteria bacterium]|nr:chaperonin GroEL [Alphaproteobacteria bacterium]